MSQENPSITFFIATIGKKTLTMMLRSIYGQFNHGVDKIEVFFDGPVFSEVGPDYFQPEQELYGNDLVIHVLPENLGCWGHSIRNTYQGTFHTDYIWNIDDDDYVPEGVLHSVREDLRTHYGKLLLYQFRNSDGIRWKNQMIEHGNLGTPSGLIPNFPDLMGHWGEWAGGDASFYATTADKIGRENIVWIPKVIYSIRPHVWGLYK